VLLLSLVRLALALMFYCHFVLAGYEQINWLIDRCSTRTVQLYLPGGAHLPTGNTYFLGPTWVHNPNGISISSAIFAQLMARCRVSSGMPRHVPFPTNFPFAWGSEPSSNNSFLGPPEPTTHMTSWSVQPFALCRAHGRVSLYFTMGRPFPQIALFHGNLNHV